MKKLKESTSGRIGRPARRRQPTRPALKHNPAHDNGGSEPVRFEFTHPTAATVCVAGTFNDWQPAVGPMRRVADGRWLEETALPPGTYEYRLVVDGQWMPDPLATESVPNPFGGSNSILKVASPAETTHMANAEHQPLENPNQEGTEKYA